MTTPATEMPVIDENPELIHRKRISAAMHKAQVYLLSLQQEEGYWAGELAADASVTAGYIPLMYLSIWAGRSGSPEKGGQIRFQTAERGWILGDSLWRTGGPQCEHPMLFLFEAGRHPCG